jgi:hypothetical protein
MQTATVINENLHYELRPVRWGRAVSAGLIVGAVFLLLSRGIPWASSGMVSFTLMGRELKSPGVVDGGLDFTVGAIHMLCSVIYALIIIPIIHRFRPPTAILMGMAVGFLLYLASMAVFTRMLDLGIPQHELNPFITHLAFGAVVAGFYKGQTRRRVPIEEEA